MDILNVVTQYFAESGFGQFQFTNLVMILIGLLFIWLAIKKGFEPLLLVPIGFGILIGNIPYNSASLPLSVYDGPAAVSDLHAYEVEVALIQESWDDEPVPFEVYLDNWKVKALKQQRAELVARMMQDRAFIEDAQQQGMSWQEMRDAAVTAAEQQLTLEDMHFNHTAMRQLFDLHVVVKFASVREIHDPLQAEQMVYDGRAIIVNSHSLLSAPIDQTLVDPDDPDAGYEPETLAPLVVNRGQGRAVFVHHYTTDGKYPQVWSLKRQEPSNASVFWWLFAGVGIAGFYPPLIFLGIGALTDFGPMLSNPKTLLLGAAAQFGIFGAMLGAVAIFGFNMNEAASIGIIGGADGPTAIFTASQLAPHLLGAVALAAYSYMAMVPIIQPPIIKLLTTKKERQIHMKNHASVSKTTKIIFPIAGFLLTAFLAPGGLPLLGMLFFGNLLRESMVTDRLAKTAQTTFIDIVTILLGVTVGAKTSADYFLTYQTIFIFILGILAFAIATATGVLFAKLMNAVSKDPLNPMIGAAGVSAVPMAARVVHKLGQQEDPQNFLLMHAMGPNVAGVIGSAVAAGVLLSWLAGG